MSADAFGIANLVDEINPFVRGCPQYLLFDELCRAAREVCAETSIWKGEVRVDAAPGSPSVYLDPSVLPGGPDAPAFVHTLLSASVNGRRLRVLLQDAAEWARPDSSLPGSGDIAAVAMRETDTVDVFPAPVARTPLVLRFAFVPRTDYLAWLPDTVYIAVKEAVKHVTLARLFVVADMPWTNENLATYHARQAVLAKAKLRVRDKTGAVAGSVMTKMQPFGA